MTIVLPHTWVKAACQPGRKIVSTSDTLETEDILVSDTELMWTLQHGGCGHKGYRINMPKQFLIFNQTTDLDAKSEAMMSELIKYKFGVFEETGFQDDAMYPATYSIGNNSMTNAGCTHLSGIMCETQGYQPYAPTKQNILCNGHSVRQVIKDTSDISDDNETMSEAPVNVTVRYVTQSLSRYVLVLDLGHAAETWTNIKRALWRFISLLPEGSTLSIVTVTEETNTVTLFPTVVTEARKEGLHGLIPRRSEETRVKQGCVKCGIETAIELLGAHTGNIVIVSNAQTKIEQTRDTRASFRMFSVMYTRQEDMMESNTTVYNVQDTSSSSLTEVFINILNTVENDKLEKIYHAEHQGNQISGNFYVEEFTSTDITVTLSIDDEQKVESFEVKDSTGKRNIFSKFEDGLVIIKMQGKSNPGMWSYHVKLYEDSILSKDDGRIASKIIVDVTSKSEGSSVTVTTMPSIRENSHQIVLAHVTQGTKPVLGAIVTAVLTGPGGDSLELQLKDAGTGYPDITRGDGVYSAYLPVFARFAGYHGLRVNVASGENTRVNVLSAGIDGSKCCGSEMVSEQQDSVGQFVRIYTQPSVYISETNPTMKDMTPPSRISDLKITSANTSSLIVDLKWTAPGGDLDSGKVSSYEIRCHTDPSLLAHETFSDKGILVHPVEPIMAEPYLSEQKASAGVPWTNQIFYYAIISVDSAGNVSPVSNIVSVIINELTTSTETSSLAPSQLKLGGQSWLLNTNYIIAIAGGCGGILIIIIILVVFMIFRAKRTNKEKKSKDVLDTYEAGFYPDIKLSKPEPESSNDGVYNWLDGLQQSGKKSSGNVVPAGKVIADNMDLCYEEGSSCSRPTTSTDDSLSNEEADYVNQRNNSNESNNNVMHNDQSTAPLPLNRSRMYSNSFKHQSHTRYPGYNNPHRYGPAPGLQYQVSPHLVVSGVSAAPMLHPKKQRHESVV